MSNELLFKPTGGSSSPLTTKGDLYGFNTANARIPVGSNGQILTADSAQTLGVKWAPSAGGLTVPTSQVTCNTGTGVGATNTQIRIFTNSSTSGTDITYATSSTLGDTFTINTTGVYAISYTEISSTVANYFGLLKNGSVGLTTAINLVTPAQGKIAIASFISSLPWTCSIILNLAASDIIRASAAGNYQNSSDNTLFTITRVA